MKRKISAVPPPIRIMQRGLLALCLAGLAWPAQALDLMGAWRQAQSSDPVFGAARAELDAGREAQPQGLALLLPTVNATANTQYNDAENRTFDRSARFNTNGWSITLTQPLLRWQNIAQYRQADYRVQQSEAQFGQATQDLVVRVATAYFDALAAQDNLEFVRADKTAIAEQLAQAKRNFEVGTATITDTNEAQARYDLATAQEIAAENSVEVTRRNLQQIIGVSPDRLAPLKVDLHLTPPQPASMDEWVDAAIEGNYGVRANQAAYQVALREVDVQRAGHYPSVDAIASYQENTNQSLGSSVISTRSTSTAGIVGLQLTLPLYAGGMVNSRTREAVALRERAYSNLEAARRSAEFNARQSFLNVTNGRAQVLALQQALVSSETALESNRVGYQVGVRINIDVLNAQQQVLQTKRDLARARYDTILGGLRLGAAAGTLSEAEVQAVNLLLEPVAKTTP